MNRRLLIVDRYDAVDCKAVVDGGHPEADCDILLLGLSNAWFLWTHAASIPAQHGWRLVDPEPHALEASEQVGQFVVDLVERLPRLNLGAQTLGELLATSNGSLWWFLDISEKGPLRGPLVSQLYQLALARSVIERGEYREITVSASEAWLADAFRSPLGFPAVVHVKGPKRKPAGPWSIRPIMRFCLHAAVMALRLLTVKLFLAGWTSDDTESRAATRVAGFTFYPVWWARPFSLDASDRFFSNLADAGVTGYLAWLTSPMALWRNRRQAIAVLRSRGMVPLQRYVGPADLAAVVSPRWFARIRHIERGLRTQPREDFAGFDVWPLLADEVLRSLTGIEPILDTLIARAVERRVAECPTGTVLYRLEFQPFENALVLGLRGRSRAVGFLHYAFGRHYLATRFAAGEVARYLRRADPAVDRPLPDGIVTCGHAGIEHVTNGGYPTDRCGECGPQRFGRLLRYRRKQDGRTAVRERLGLPADLRIYLVTLALPERDTEALFGALIGALGTGADYRLVIRPHPNRPQGDSALTEVLRRLEPGRAVLMQPQQDVYDLIVASDAVVCIGSMIAFEAIVLERMPVVYENPASFPALSLSEFAEGLFVAHDADTLRLAIASIVTEAADAREKRRHWPSVVNRVMGDLETPLPDQLRAALSRLEPTQ